MQKINACLWFNNQAEEASKFYVSVFKNSKIKAVSHYGEGQPLAKGTVMTVSFELDGQDFLALNGGTVFKISPAISFIVNCKTQDEIDFFWDKLSEGGEKQDCGWLKDKFGVSWQVVPTVLGELMSSADAEQSQRVMSALLKMKKLDIKTLQQAYKKESVM
jgi:predicted 3-demethylubiquinone-9 3-methyltransferase (glyoxalase superfamily)